MPQRLLAPTSILWAQTSVQKESRTVRDPKMRLPHPLELMFCKNMAFEGLLARINTCWIVAPLEEDVMLRERYSA